MGLIFSQSKKGDSVSQHLLGPFRQREGRSPWQQSIFWDVLVVQSAMNIIDKAKSTPPAPNREAFSKSRECISVCWHFWYWKTYADTGYQEQKLLSQLEFNSLVAGLPDEDIWRLTQWGKAVMRGRSDLLLAQHLPKEPQSCRSVAHLHKNKRWQCLGGWLQDKGGLHRGLCCGWHLHGHLRAGGDRQEKFRSETSLEQENTTRRIPKKMKDHHNL